MPSAAKTRPGAAATDVARVAALPQVHAGFAWFQRHERELCDWQMELTRIPAPPFGEAARAVWLAERFRNLGLEEVEIDAIGNVTGLRRGADSDARCLALGAHIDTVFPADVPRTVHRDDEKLYGPGISDNAAGVVALLALAAAMREASLATAAPVLFIGNVGEEGEGDLRGMRHIFIESRWKDAIGATLIVDGASMETIVTEGLGSRRFEVTIGGPGGHSWSDFGAPNPIVLLARAIDRFSRTAVPMSPKTTFNIGVVQGGTSVNSIPESATMRVDIRSSEARQLDRLEAGLRDAVSCAVDEARGDVSANGAAGAVSFDVRPIGSRPAAELREDSRLLAVVTAVDAHLGNASRLIRASTDANIPLSLGREAVAVGSGGTGGGAHTIHEWYDPRGRDLGLKRLLLIVAAMAGAE
jgi:acetylornithine deacetylase/succinyl-diaminopimelate desuccinylase-like protein